MSWEDCGFKPGKINGNPKCARYCSDCDGEHHFYASCSSDGIGLFVCKHCDATAEMIETRPKRAPSHPWRKR